MFGILYSAIMSIGALAHKVKDDCQNIENKKKYRNDEEGTYIDTKGRTRLLSNDEYVLRGPGANGDDVLCDKHGKVIRNFSEEKRVDLIYKQQQEAIEKGKTVYPIEPTMSNGRPYNYGNRTPVGRRYRDRETGEIYVVGKIKDYRPGVYCKWKSYYIRVSDGMAVRKTDGQIELDRIDKNALIKKYDYDDIDLEEFNKNIKEKYNFNNEDSKRHLFLDNYELSNSVFVID